MILLWFKECLFFLFFFLSKKGFLTWGMGKIRTLFFCFSFFQRQRCVGWFYHVHWFEEDSAMNYDGKGFLIWGRSSFFEW